MIVLSSLREYYRKDKSKLIGVAFTKNGDLKNNIPTKPIAWKKIAIPVASWCLEKDLNVLIKLIFRLN